MHNRKLSLLVGGWLLLASGCITKITDHPNWNHTDKPLYAADATAAAPRGQPVPTVSGWDCATGIFGGVAGVPSAKAAVKDALRQYSNAQALRVLAAHSKQYTIVPLLGFTQACIWVEGFPVNSEGEPVRKPEKRAPCNDWVWKCRD